MPKKVIAYNLENTALASLCDCKYDVQRDIIAPSLSADIVIMTALSAAVASSPLTILIADCHSDDKIEYGELSYFAYSMLSGIKVSNIEDFDRNAFTGFPEGFDEVLSPLVSFESSSDDIIPLSITDDGRVISFMRISGDRYLVVIPYITDYEKLGAIVQKIERTYLKFSECCKDTGFDIPSRLDKLLTRRSDTEAKLSMQLSEIDNEIRSSFPEYIFLRELVSRDDVKFSSSVRLYLSAIGLNASDNPDILSLPDGTLLLYSSDSSSGCCCNLSKISTKLKSIRKKNKDISVHALLVVNHQKYLSTDKRSIPFTELEAEAASSSDITITSAVDLIKVYENMKQGIITKEYIIQSLTKGGYADFSFPEDRLIGVISKVGAEDKHICRFYLDNRSIRKGMKLIIEDKAGAYRTARIVSLAVGRVQMADAVDGEVTLTLDSEVSSGEHLYFC